MKPFATILSQPILLKQWPLIDCPHCRTGALALEETTVAVYENPYFNSNEFYENDGEPESVSGTFAAPLTCAANNCKCITLAFGDFAFQEVPSYDNEPRYERKFAVRGFHPPIDVSELAGDVPEAIRAELSRIGALVWNDPRAASTALRAAVEVLLNEQRVTRSSKTGAPLTLSNRISEFQKGHPEVTHLLDAVRIVGNAGTHEQSPTSADNLLRAMEFVESALDKLYPPPPPLKYATSDHDANILIAADRQRRKQ
ncbi:DUF4145 domain-containing protein [Rhodococcus erythropolis]|uniref:DUF4145 domain-containing protein n=1 Tax=Rhodococcus erythropolis TaxID=1833 RepID=UPI001BECBA2A|nr:DUF4145 domain-containing protein [Rhodococcus erythropolis]MBT2269848.1 DUF4145 domain-containing protein [Rhodococcus erythropolis]